MKNSFTNSFFILIIAFCFGCENINRIDTPVRQKVNFDFDWRFSKGDFPVASQRNFDDSQWEVIDVPHDWAILDEFSEDNPTGRPGGFSSGGVGWYRKTFTLGEEAAEANVSIEFGGVYEKSEVWIKGPHRAHP